MKLSRLGAVSVQDAVITQHVQKIGEVFFEGCAVGGKKTFQGIQNLSLVFAFLKEADNFLARVVGAKRIPGGGVEHKTVLGDGDILADFHAGLDYGQRPGFNGVQLVMRTEPLISSK